MLSELELGFWVDYIERVFRIEHTFIQIGVFAYNLIKMEEKFSFLERGIPVIPFAEIRKNTLDVMKKILYYFEAKGTRKFIRVRAFGKTEAFFDIEGTYKPINGKIIDISAYAFSCQIQLMHAPFFTVGEILHNVLLVLKGARVRTTVKLIGISKVNPQVHVFKYHREKMVNNKTVNKKGLSIQNKNKVHNYIRLCLKENLKKQLEEVIEYTDN